MSTVNCLLLLRYSYLHTLMSTGIFGSLIFNGYLCIMSTKHFSFRLDTELFEKLKASKPKGISMSAHLVQLLDQGQEKPESVYEETATREVERNRMVHQNTYDEMIRAENNKAQESFHLSQGHLTFNEIIEKHAVELEKKYK
ncbi:hypothetical protein LCGC14_0278300 [marine sediment metagenome]|uniref:Uncharacterized protein n=1 Tax=marine sediment metagenome TaxID=412755 RepID=A0A0F9UDP4_9ZZZZ